MSSLTRADDGLTADEAARRLGRDGPNRLPPPQRVHPAMLFARQLVHFFAAMLWVAAVLAMVAGMPTLSIAIGIVVIVNAVFALVQEYRADRAAERLRDLLPARATVRRGGRSTVVAADDLVVGDLLLLEAGDRVCADAAMTSGEVSVDDSMLTGESRPVHRRGDETLYAGSYVSEGHAGAVVTATGVHTRLARIAAVTAGLVVHEVR